MSPEEIKKETEAKSVLYFIGLALTHSNKKDISENQKNFKIEKIRKKLKETPEVLKTFENGLNNKLMDATTSNGSGGNKNNNINKKR